ncbi:helix-hairpin-helix domain-containing protein [candidate division KSB1 bacterium]|nr:helix-hairpin-helix domain-containing protein [candidate division KSB1 bacterium]
MMRSLKLRWIFGTSLILLIWSVAPITAQSIWEEDLLEQILDLESDFSAEQIASLEEHPIDLNKAGIQDLTAFPLITPHLARRIVEQRRDHGPFKSFMEFILRLNLDKSFWQQLKSFFKVTNRKQQRQPRFRLRNRVTYNTPHSKGLLENDYPGAPVKSYGRIRLRPSEIFEIGILSEKDAGEPNWTDHTVGFLQLSLREETVRILIGNFIVESGFGLVLWGPYRFSGGSNPIAPYKVGVRGPVGYVSADENHSLRGVAGEIQMRKWTGHLYASDSRMDASLSQNGTIQSFGTSGLHRTESELFREDTASEKLLGLDISRAFSKGVVGVTAFNNQYTLPWAADLECPLEFSDDRNTVAGIYYSLTFRDWNFNGEIAASKSGGTAIISNALYETTLFSTALSLRNYEPDFHNLHANGPARYATQNEQGGTFGLLLKKQFMDRVSIRYDLFRRPWNSYSMSIPYYGNDFFIQVEKTLIKDQKLQIRYRIRREEDNYIQMLDTGRESSTIGQRIHQQVRVDLQSKLTKKWTLRHRLEWVCFSEPGRKPLEIVRESGFLIFHEIRYQPFPALRISVRYTGFQSDSYDSRLYTYESDVPGGFSIPVLYGQGARHYILMDYKIRKWCRLGIKYSEIYHDRESEWGSGLDCTDGDIRRTFTFQADLQF